jgi:hypothetical protein
MTLGIAKHRCSAHEGTMVCNVMPKFVDLTNDELMATIAFLRQLPPLMNEVPETECEATGHLQQRCFVYVFTVKKKPTAPKRIKPKNGYEAVMQLDETLRAADHPDYRRIAWKKVKAGDLAAAEKKLGIALPPSYKAFVTKHGVFVISGEDVDRYDRVETKYDRMLPPSFLVKATLGVRRYRRGEDDEELVNDAVMFQSHPYHEEFFAFRISSRRKDGEMTVGEWLEGGDGGWPRGFKSFDDHLIALCEQWHKKLR